MNIFLPYEDDIVKSVQSLDDVRLQKQAVEVYQLLTLAIKEQQKGHEVKAGHYHHPVYLFYKDNIPFLAYYGYICCCEYLHRFYKRHSLLEYFQDRCSELLDINCYVNSVEGIFVPPKFAPYYMEGSKGQPNYIRTITDVEILFQSKLISKWQNDKKQPKWSNRKIPIFYQNYLNLSENDKNKYWEYILNIKRKHYGKS